MFTVKEITPEEAGRKAAYDMFVNAPMPMVTTFRTADVSNLVKLSKKGFRFNMLMCYCVGLAASGRREFLIVPNKKKLYLYEGLAIDVVVLNRNGELSYADIPFSEDIGEFSAAYDLITKKVYESCEHQNREDLAVIGTSVVRDGATKGVVNSYSGVFDNPFIIWNGVTKKLFKSFVNISFQFNHIQMDGLRAEEYLSVLTERIKELSIR